MRFEVIVVLHINISFFLGCDALLFIDRLLADIVMCQPNCRQYLSVWIRETN